MSQNTTKISTDTLELSAFYSVGFMILSILTFFVYIVRNNVWTINLLVIASVLMGFLTPLHFSRLYENQQKLNDKIKQLETKIKEMNEV